MTDQLRVHICTPPGRYVGQVRMRGFRRWRTVTKRHNTAERALAAAARRFCRYDHRLRVLWVGDEPCYYDPHVAIEAVRQ